MNQDQMLRNSTADSSDVHQAVLFAAEVPITVLILLLYIIMGHKFETYKELSKKKEAEKIRDDAEPSSNPNKRHSFRRTYSELQAYEIDHRVEGFSFRGFSCAFHESGPAIILGLAAGLLLQNVTDEDITFNPNMFYYFVLPPIIFYQGYALKKKNFFKYLQYIFLYGIVGTVIQFGIVASVTFWLTNYVQLLKLVNPEGEHYSLSVQESMIAAACFSAADEVATLSLIKANEHPKLSAVLFGEGVFNDAMSILLYKTVDKTYSSDEDSGLDLASLVRHCGMLLLIGFLVGVGVALVISRILKTMPSMKQNPAKQTAVIMLGGYFSFCALEMFGQSGILSVFFCGVTLSHYAWHSLAPEAKTSTRITFDTMSICAEAYCFTCIGMSIHSIEVHAWSWRLIVSMLVALIISRAVAIYGISLIGWLVRPTSFTINFKEQSVLVMGGLVRGAIAWAQVSQVSVEHADIIRTTTLGVIMMTTIFFGILLPPFIKWLGLDTDGSDILKSNRPTKLQRRQSYVEGAVRNLFFLMDDKFLRPIFGASKVYRPHNSGVPRLSSFTGGDMKSSSFRISPVRGQTSDENSPLVTSPLKILATRRKSKQDDDDDDSNFDFTIFDKKSQAMSPWTSDDEKAPTLPNELAERFKNRHERQRSQELISERFNKERQRSQELLENSKH